MSNTLLNDYYKQGDGCYKHILEDDTPLNTYMEEHFTKKRFENLPFTDADINSCKDEAIQANKDFFLISDVSFTGDKKGAYSCYIPKAKAKCDYNNLQNLLDPFNDVINTLLGSNEGTDLRNQITDISNITEIPETLDDTTRCYNYNNKLFLPTTNNFVIYKTDLIDNKNIYDNIGNIRTFEQQEAVYNEKFNDEEFTDKIDNIASALNRYFCQNLSRNTENELDTHLNILTENYEQLFTALNDITEDISKIKLVTQADTDFLKAVQKDINRKETEYRNLTGFDGAHNGKLNDTNYLKNFKLSETLILFIIIVFIIYFYNKKK